MKWIELTSDDLEQARQQAEGVAMIPIGSIERHGPHMPLGTDTFAVLRVAEMVEALEPIVVLPVLTYTHVAVCVFHPGAIHIRQDALLNFAVCICDEVYRNGFDKIVLLHGHGGNVPLGAPILNHTLEARKPYALYSIGIGGEARLRREMQESEHAGHAGEFETSVGLYAYPDLVKMDRVQGARYDPGTELDVAPAETAVDWISRWGQMVVGEPDKATPEKGQRLLEARAATVAETLRKIKRDTVVPERLRQRRAMRI